jgi:hypothetical protein
MVSTSVGPRDLVVSKTTTIPCNFKNLISDCRLLVCVVVLLGIVTHNKQQCKPWPMSFIKNVQSKYLKMWDISVDEMYYVNN